MAGIAPQPTRRSTRRYWRPFAVGAAGGLLAFVLSEQLSNRLDLAGTILSSAVWGAAIGLGLGLVLVVFDNRQSMRGRWTKDLMRGSLLFAVAGLVSTGLAQWFYQSGETTSLTRGVGWAIFGLAIGSSLGLLRRDRGLTWRGALGGAVGGFIGGLAFNTIAVFAVAGDGQVARAFGIVILGAAIAVLVQVVQEVFRGASLMGMTTGPLEGREIMLTKTAVTVGRAESHDVSLYRDPSVPATLGSLRYDGGRWKWTGAPVPINDTPGQDRELLDGDVIQFGVTRFLFSLSAPAARSGLKAHPPEPVIGAREAQADAAAPPVRPPGLEAPVPTPRAWRLAGRLLPTGTTSVGRAASNDLILDDPTVSSAHARLDVGPFGVTVVDLKSTNGTALNGRSLAPGQPALAGPNDEITFGGVRMRLEAAANGAR